MTKQIQQILTLTLQQNKMDMSLYAFCPPCFMRVMRSVRRLSARSGYKISAGRQHVTSLASHPSHVTCHCPDQETQPDKLPMTSTRVRVQSPLFDIRRSQVVICGRLAGVWLASVNEAVFGVIIFLLSSYYLIIILLSGVMASIHHTSYSHCGHCSSAVQCSIGFTIGFHNHGDGP